MALVVTSEAQEDIRDTARWYSRQRRGLGRRFTTAVRAGFHAIGMLPQGYGVANPPIPGREVRRFNLPSFPDAIYYEVRGLDQFVLAIIHTSMQPGSWHARLPGDPP